MVCGQTTMAHIALFAKMPLGSGLTEWSRPTEVPYEWPATEKRYEPGVLREKLGRLFEDYPGLRLLTMDALYAERDLCRAIVSHGRDYLVRVRGTSRRSVRPGGGVCRSGTGRA